MDSNDTMDALFSNSSYNPYPYRYDSYQEMYYEAPNVASSSSYTERPLIPKAPAKTLSKAPIRTKPGPDPIKVVHKLENGVRKACRKVTDTTIELCSKIYEKSRSVISIARKRRSIKFHRRDSVASFSNEIPPHLRIGYQPGPEENYF